MLEMFSKGKKNIHKKIKNIQPEFTFLSSRVRSRRRREKKREEERRREKKREEEREGKCFANS